MFPFNFGSGPADRYFKLQELLKRKEAEDASKTPSAPAHPNPQRRSLPEVPVVQPALLLRCQTALSGLRNITLRQAFLAFVGTLVVQAIGGVLGDLGTSVLYTWNEVFFGPHGIPVNSTNVLGAASVIFWTLMISPTYKYLSWVFKAHNHGEGGPYALRTGLNGWIGKSKVGMTIGLFLIFAVCLMCGEAIITPAISVLGAIEGVGVAIPGLSTGVIDGISIAIIIGVFVLMQQGTKTVGMIAGPIVILWLLAIGFVGIFPLLGNLEILKAINPYYAVHFLAENGLHESMIILGGLVLCYTGGEAFWGDLGHFGAKALRWAWGMALPFLIINYFGQGAYLLSGGEVVNGNVFYSSMPVWAQIPMIPLATLAAIIASFAMVLATMSAAHAAVNESWLPPMDIKNTNPHMEGQVYNGLVNWGICFGSVTLVLMFQTSLKLAGAYGMSVTAVMLTTSIALSALAITKWNWSVPRTLITFAPFLLLDGAYFFANVLKFMAGGYIPVLIGSCIMAIKVIWFYGRKAMWAKLLQVKTMQVSEFITRRSEWVIMNRTVFVLCGAEMTAETGLPGFFQDDVNRRGVAPKHTLFIHVARAKTPFVDEADRYTVTWLSDPEDMSFTVRAVEIKFGYAERRRVPAIINRMRTDGVPKLPQSGWLVLMGTDKVVGEGSLLHRAHMAAFGALKRLAPGFHEYIGFDGSEGIEVEEIVNHIQA